MSCLEAAPAPAPTPTPPPHVLIFPLPAQGHMNSMLKLAQLLCLAEFDVTFIVSDFNHHRLLNHTSTVHSTFDQYPGFQFQTITDGLPEEHPRAGHGIMDLIPSAREITGPVFKKMMIDKNFFASANRRPVTCIIADGVLTFVADFVEQYGIPLIYFRTISAYTLWIFFFIDKLVEADEVPVKGNELDELVKSIPGMEGFLRQRDLPGIFRVHDANDPTIHDVAAITKQNVRAQAAILNTFDDLEGPIISHIRKHFPKLYTIGPNQAHLNSRLTEKKVRDSLLSSSLWAEDWSCIDWLNAQKPKSVIYVSFGSVTIVTREQILEFWHGLVSSGKIFLWVMRPDSIADKKGESQKQKIPVELVEGTKERGYMVEWAPQEQVLNHPAVGGFLTHSGWNSTLESIAAGVPMICWPYLGDQLVNSRFASEVLKVGLDIKDTCDRVVIENAIREVMETRKDEFLERADQMAKLAKRAVSEGGSSYCNLDGLIEYIRSLII